MTELDIDLIDSKEAMLVLNNLPNVQILNGRSTKDDDDEDEDVEGDEEYIENNDNEENMNTNNIYNNAINRNNHLYSQMEEIEEDKNLENNYISDTNINDNKNINNNSKNNDLNINANNDLNTNNDRNTNDDMIINKDVNTNIEVNNKNKNNNIDNLDSNRISQENENENINGNYKEKMTSNIITIDEKGLNPEIDSDKDLFQSNNLLYDKIISNNSKKKLLNANEEQNINVNISNNYKVKEKERESLYDYNNSNDEKNNRNENENNVIDLTNDELNSLIQEKYGENSALLPLIKEFCVMIDSNEGISDGERLQNNYKEKLQSIEDKKDDIPKYYYFFLLYKKKIKILQNMENELYYYILNKYPEINKNDILLRINTELFNTIKDSKDFINIMHSHIESYTYKKVDTNNGNNNDNFYIFKELIKEKDKKILSLEQSKNKLLQNLEEIKSTYEKRISRLEKENKIMTEKLFTKANNMINSTIVKTQNTIPFSERSIAKPNINNNNKNKNKKIMLNNEILNANLLKSHNRTSQARSPNKLNDITNTIENLETINYYLNTYSNINTNKQQIMTLKTLKDFINELYSSKSQYDIKCIQNKLPKETLEEHMYTLLNKKYGLKNLIIEWAKNIIAGIKYYSKKDSYVLLFGKIMRNEQEEDARFIIQKVAESIEELLLYYIKKQNPLKLTNEINKLFEKKKKSELFEEEWKGIIYSIYEKEEAQEIEKKIEIFINKENEKKKLEMFKKYKQSRINKQNNNKYNNNTYMNANNNSYMNTINSLNNASNNNSSYMDTIGNTNNKLSRIDKYNMLMFMDEKNIIFNDFIKIVLDNHIRFRDKQLKKFLELFRSVDTDRDGIINEEEFTELIHRMKIFKEEESENKIFQFLEILDPFDNQKFTFSECVKFFSGEIIKDKDINGIEKEVSILEKICYNEKKIDKITINNNDNEQIIVPNFDSNKNIITTENNNNDVNNNNNNDK